MDELLALADLMGVSVEWEDFLPLGWAGAFWLATATVYMLRGMPRSKTRTVLGHELGHAHYRHAGRTTADEWHADKWAARKLITPEGYLEASWDRPSLEVLARRLGVTPHMAEVFIRSARAPGNFTELQPLKLRQASPTVLGLSSRPVEPRRLTQAFPRVPAAAARVTVQPVPRVTVEAIPRELVLA
jgi:hypothetical protein